MLVYVFGGNVNAAVLPFKGVGDGERLEAARLTKGRKRRVSGDDIGEIECAALAVVESDLQRVVRYILCVCDF